MKLGNKMIHPLIYLGPKDEMDMGSVLGTPTPAVFRVGPHSNDPSSSLHGQKYFDVTEDQGRVIMKRWGTTLGKAQYGPEELFAWPDDTRFGIGGPSREEFEAVLDRLQALEGALRAATVAKPINTGGRPPKPKEVASVA
jgi:hypothetical protein